MPDQFEGLISLKEVCYNGRRIFGSLFVLWFGKKMALGDKISAVYL